ncbi:hypothetical protein [Ammonifex degensii]|uniref:hypothetical protein n=1 Tax=Ammonifex degensii TaxID=42838 RepID=UPI0002E83CD8|nr:hypothetical protein [Ammonifex degensii]
MSLYTASPRVFRRLEEAGFRPSRVSHGADGVPVAWEFSLPADARSWRRLRGALNKVFSR